MQLLGDRILIKPEQSKSVTESGLHLPEQSIKKETRGEIVSVGTGRPLTEPLLLPSGKILWEQPLTLKPGQTVIYSDYAGTHTELDGEDMLILREDEIMAVV
jgi:chaperonin GroES